MMTKNLPAILILSLFTINFSYADTEEDNGTLPLDELRTFTRVFTRIKNDYVEPVSDRTLLKNAIRGMLAGLDPHSTWLDDDVYKTLQEDTSGEFSGIGIEVGMEDGFVKVISPIDDTPAQRAGVRAGDLIIRLDAKSVKGMTLDEAVKLMRGEPGSNIVLTIIRETGEKPLTITVTRDIIVVKSVRGRTLEPGFGYARISNFQPHTKHDLRKLLEKLKTENDDGLNGLVLDLRNNPGGILEAAVDVSDLFIDGGLIVYTKGRMENSKMEFNARPFDIIEEIPIIVLVNGGSASASEIVAGALQDHKRAIIMGQPTFGKGSVQTVLPITGEAALKLTTARYYTPAGRSIQTSGIEPDIVIDNVHINGIPKTVTEQIKETDLSGHLKNDQTDPKAETPREETGRDKPSLAEMDYPLYEALNILKGLAIHLNKTAG